MKTYMSVRVVGQVGGVDFELMPISQASEILGYSPVYIRRLADEGKLIATKIGRCWFVYPQLIATVAPPLLQDTS